MDKKERLVEILTSENVREEIEKNKMFIFGLFPRLQFSEGFYHRDLRHSGDVWNHTLDTLENSENKLTVRLALLFHDIGKPFSYQETENGLKTFKGHEKMSEYIAREYLEELGFSQNMINKVGSLVFESNTKIAGTILKRDQDYLNDLIEVQKCNIASYDHTRNKTKLAYLINVKQKTKN